MKYYIILLFSLHSFSIIGQKVEPISEQEATTKGKTDVEQNHEIEKNQIKIEALETLLENKASLYEQRVNNKIDKLDSKIDKYLFFGSAILAIIVFLINFLGRKLIKERVEVLIKNTATDYAKLKIDELVYEYTKKEKIDKLIREKGEPAIKKLLSELEERGSDVIAGIQKKGDDVISSMIARKEDTKEEAQSGASSDDEILSANLSSRASEFFDLAFTRKDPLVQIELYKNVLELEPENLEALNNIGVSYNNSYNYNEAIKHLTKCIELDAKFVLAYANRANSYNSLDELDKALTDANKAISIDPKGDWGYVVKGNVLTKKGEWKEAEKIFGLAIKLNPNSPEAYFNRGFFYEEIKEYQKSENDYFKAENLGFPNKAGLYNNMAVLYRRQKNFDLSIEYLEKARKINPSFPNIDGTMALIYADKKDRDNFYKYLIIALDKGCPAWNYIKDSGFDEYRKEEKLEKLLQSYKSKYVA